MIGTSKKLTLYTKRPYIRGPYRVTLAVAYLGWVDIDLYVAPSCTCSYPANPAKLPSARQKQPDCGMAKMIVIPT